MKLTATLAAAVIAATAASAEIESTQIYTSGMWALDHEVYDDGRTACAASTLGSGSTWFDMTVFQDGTTSVMIMFDHTVGDPFLADVTLRVDGIGYTLLDTVVADTPYGAVASFLFGDPDDLAAFRDLIAGGRIMTLVSNTTGAPTVAWSLEGSRAALTAQAECLVKIQPLF